MNQPDKQAFQSAIGSKFTVPFEDDTSFDLILEELEDKHHLDQPGTQNFALIFSGRADQALPQQSFHLNHAELGALFVFLVPIDEKDGKRLYQAVFSIKQEEQVAD